MREHSCNVKGCTKPHRAKGWCSTHYSQWKRGTLGNTRLYVKGGRRCKIHGCDRPFKALGLCKYHWTQWYRGTLEVNPDRMRPTKDRLWPVEVRKHRGVWQKRATGSRDPWVDVVWEKSTRRALVGEDGRG